MTLAAVGKVIRKDARTKHLVLRLQPGDIALINHPDLDATAAQALADRHPSAVVNAAISITGRYPNRGPAVLSEAGIPILDNVGDAAFTALPDGIIGGLVGNELVTASGVRLTGNLLNAASIEELMQRGRENLRGELDHFARNTLGFLNAEQSLLFDALSVPKLQTRIKGRHVLIVVRGEGHAADLAMLKEYLRDSDPVLLAVDGGADALLNARLKPSIILGDMDSISDQALKCGAELVVHAYKEGDPRGAPGMARVLALGLNAVVMRAAGTSEDAAMLLADELGATLIVAVGTHFSLEDFLDKGRQGMASTFLTRLRIGSKLVDAKGIGRLWAHHHPRFREMALVVVAAGSAVLAVLGTSPMGRNLLETLSVWLRISSR
ncbi:MAG: hypothetical protein KGJ62_07280 [Armatimonadetes bacterium]|nr:hypothetical protein [Armatimonadota bacterium]MDE2206941.1 hypothetical protein [Armatimonadota bacterium]